MSKRTVDVVHFSDVLCIWAYITQIRVAELQANFPDEVHLDYRFLQVFGDVSRKIEALWGDRGGLPAYATHVQEVAATFPHISISPDAWLVNTPTSSLPAHVMLCGAKVLCATDPGGVDADLVERLLGALRYGFFVETADISRQPVLFEIAAQADVDIKALARVMDNGKAHAQLADDLAAAAQDAVRASPTLILNEGRQVLAGNVGYRVVEANVRELLTSPGEQQSWC